MTGPYRSPANDEELTPLLDHTTPDVSEYTAVFEPGLPHELMLEEAHKRARSNGLAPVDGPTSIEHIVDLGSKTSEATWPNGIVLFTIAARELRAVERSGSAPEFNRVRLMQNRHTGQGTKREVRQ